MKVAIIAIAKCENLYVNEWVNYHLHMGFDNIIICDNNNSDGEKISDVINDDRVIILNYHDKGCVQPMAYTEEFLKYKNSYDWIAFIDIDEFIVLDEKYHNSIKEFLSDSMFEKADVIRLSWKILTTKTELDVVDGNYNVFDRFKDTFEDVNVSKFVKSIIKGNIEYVGGRLLGHGYYKNHNLTAMSADGKICDNTWNRIHTGPIYVNAWINHYPTKTIGEYVRQKFFRGGPNANNVRYSNLTYFFMYNEKNAEVEKYGNKIIQEMLKSEKNKKFYEKFVKGVKI